MLYRRTLLPIVSFVVLASSCRLFRPINPQGNAEPRQAADTAAAAEPAAQIETRPINMGSLNDANIAAVILASNNTDISYARLVPTRAERVDVKQFAQRMLTDHVGINALVTDLLIKIDLTPADNIASLDLRDESASKRDVLRELSGYAFDSTYIENEVSYHRKFLYSIDNQLAPRARNAELKTLLTSVRPAIAAHLAHAEQVRANVLTKK